MGDVTTFRKPGPVRDPHTGDDLAAIVDKLNTIERAASDLRFDIENAAGILAVCADCDTPIEDDERAWLQVEYVAKQIRRHSEDLGLELGKVEHVAMALSRAMKASETPPAEGGAA